MIITRNIWKSEFRRFSFKLKLNDKLVDMEFREKMFNQFAIWTTNFYELSEQKPEPFLHSSLNTFKNKSQGVPANDFREFFAVNLCWKRKPKIEICSFILSSGTHNLNFNQFGILGNCCEILFIVSFLKLTISMRHSNLLDQKIVVHNNGIFSFLILLISLKKNNIFTFCTFIYL